MLPPKQSAEVLVKMFRKKYIANLDELFEVLDTRSRMSVFRRLKPLGYLPDGHPKSPTCGHLKIPHPTGPIS